MVLGEMDGDGEIARVNPYPSGQGELPMHTAWFASHRPAAATQFRGRLEIGLLPLGPGYPGLVDDIHQDRITEDVGE